MLYTYSSLAYIQSNSRLVAASRPTLNFSQHAFVFHA